MYSLENKIAFIEIIDSTQKEMWRRLQDKMFEAEVIIAKIQTSGIGTHGRCWYSNEDNIIFSVGINLSNVGVTIDKLDGLTINIAEIIVKVFKELYNINSIKIKIPNDLILNDKKIGGILTETKLLGSDVKALCLGIGINTNQENFENIEEIKNIATSIKKELGIEINNLEVIKLFLKYFEENLYKRIGK